MEKLDIMPARGHWAVLRFQISLLLTFQRMQRHRCFFDKALNQSKTDRRSGPQDPDMPREGAVGGQGQTITTQIMRFWMRLDDDHKQAFLERVFTRIENPAEGRD